jgi:adenosylmethionine-8-amino-7-oxononanoate aminotransferase
LVGPPFIITESEISELLELFRDALEMATNTVYDRMSDQRPI